VIEGPTLDATQGIGGFGDDEAHAASKAVRTKSDRKVIETPDGLMNEVAAGAFLALKMSTRQNRRSKRESPTYVKLGRRVFDKHEDFERFNEERFKQER
jgi:hypothetical protein